MYTKPFKKKYWTPELKVPISKLKVDKSLFSFHSEISRQDVLYILMYFDRSRWEPILVNQEYCILDGQHRLAVAKLLGLEYVDVVVQDTKLLETE